MVRLLCHTLLLGASALLAADPPELAGTRTKYEERLAAYTAAYEQVAAAGLQRYGLNLKHLEADARKRGDLEGLVAVRGEIKRMSSEASVPQAPPSDASPALTKAIKAYWNVVGKSQQTLLQQRLALLKAYEAALEKHQKALTLKDQLDDAVTVRDARLAAAEERKQLAAGPAGTVTAEAEKPKPAEAKLDHHLPEALRDGLKLHFAFEQADPLKTEDLSGNGHVATRSVADWSPDGKRGGALRCSGKEGLWVGEAAELAFAGPFTMAAWICMDQAIPGQREQQFIIGHSDYDADTGYILLTYMPHAPGINFRGHHRGRGTRDLVWEGARDFKAGEWFHIAATYDGTRMRIYANGRSQSLKPHKGGFKPHRGALKIGEDYAGLIDELVLFDRALDRREIQQLVRHADEHPAP